MPILLLCPISSSPTVKSQPQRAGLTEVDPVQPAINLQGRAYPSGTPRQISHSIDAAISLHDRDANGWLDRPDQNARTHADASLETLSMNEMPKAR